MCIAEAFFLKNLNSVHWQNGNWIQKYFSLLIRGLDGYESWKNRGRKSRDTHSFLMVWGLIRFSFYYYKRVSWVQVWTVLGQLSAGLDSAGSAECRSGQPWVSWVLYWTALGQLSAVLDSAGSAERSTKQRWVSWVQYWTALGQLSAVLDSAGSAERSTGQCWVSWAQY